jgi:cation-transporting ATPase E
VPTAILLIDTQRLDLQADWRECLGSAGAVFAMVPEGFILLTSVALAEALVRLGQHRVLVQDVALPKDLTSAALLVFAERLRSDAAATLSYFAKEGVALKEISGDNPQTVAAIATAAGSPGTTPIDGRQLPTDPERLGEVMERVAPHQKRDMIAALKRRGHVVGMVGDGINDVLALKDADLGVAVGSRTAAARTVAQLVLLEDSFVALPTVIAEGRRVVANIERTGNLFLAKTSYVLLMAIAAEVEFPFLPRH